MDHSINPIDRPSRLPLLAHITVVALLLLSFISGALIWYGEYVNDITDLNSTPFNVQPWRVLHGVLNPFLCVLFGSLLIQHIRIGWRIKANRVSGFLMEAVISLLILTGAGIYYAPESWQEWIAPTHKIFGLLVPLSLTIHWIAAQIWVKKNCQK